MKPSLLISLVLAVLLTAVAASSAASRSSLQRLPGFRSPSGNIRCFVANKLYCSIASSDYAGRLQARCMGPDGSGVDWHGFVLAPSTKGRVYCTSNPPYDSGKQRPSYRLLPYGHTFERGIFTCSSRVIGVTCRNGHGHGLFISRQAWRTS